MSDTMGTAPCRCPPHASGELERDSQRLGLMGTNPSQMQEALSAPACAARVAPHRSARAVLDPIFHVFSVMHVPVVHRRTNPPYTAFLFPRHTVGQTATKGFQK